MNYSISNYVFKKLHDLFYIQIQDLNIEYRIWEVNTSLFEREQALKYMM